MSQYNAIVTIIVDDGEVKDNEIDFAILNDLEEFGLSIDRIDHDEGIIEGVIPAHLLQGLWRRTGIAYVRDQGRYFSDHGDC